MSYVTPNTTLRVLKNVLLDPSYINTIYFENVGEQIAYFTDKTKYVFNNLTYQRHSRNKIQIEKSDDDLYDCTYLMFQNTGYGNKWFYAFITDVEYVSDKVSVITYELDFMQTYLFDVTLQPCMIERNHLRKTDDVIGASITPEPFTMGEYTYENQHVVKNFSTYALVIQVVDATSATDCGILYEHNFSGAKLWIHKLTDIAVDVPEIQQFIMQYSTHIDKIIGMYLIPNDFYDPSQLDADGFLMSSNLPITFYGQVVDSIDGTELFDDYTPRNKKLYTYPYNYCEVITGNSKSMALRYEFSKDNTVRVNIDTNLQTPVSALVRPTNYKGINRPEGLGEYPDVFGMALEIDDFPMSSFRTDTYSQWVSRNAGPALMSAGLTMAGIVLPYMSPTYSYELTDAGKVVQSKLTQMTLNPEASRRQARWFNETDETDLSNGVIQALPNAVSFAQQWYQAKIAPDNYNGSTSHGNNIVANGKTNLYGRRCHVTKEQAQIIDSYFDKFGYAIGKIGAMNRAQRSEWTYLKTQGCVLKGTCPAKVVTILQGIYDRGITWWRDGDHIGQYNLPND